MVIMLNRGRQLLPMAFHGASSSFLGSSSSIDLYNHDVFLSFRGKDVRRTFISHLYYALCIRKIKTYMDDNLERGEEISAALYKAIEGSKISIVVFSEKYTESSWCLNELLVILYHRQVKKQIVVPIFYNINPSEVRHQKGDFGKSLDKLGDEVKDNTKLLKWRVALEQASHLAGFELGNRKEAGFVQEICQWVESKIVDHISPSVAKYPNGMQSRVQDIDRLSNVRRNDVRIGGIGGEEEERTERCMITTTLPEECIPFTLDSAATSDLKRESPDYQEIISSSSSSSSSLNNPILIGSSNNVSFQIDELSRKKCLMLSAWELIIEHSDNPQCWKWISSTESIPGLPQSRFSEVGLLLEVYWLDIKGRIETKDLSPNTKYGAYFIYSMAADGLQGLRQPVKVSIYTLKKGDERVDTNAYLHQPIKRADMWMEIEIGEFFCDQVDDVVEMCVKEVEFLNRKSGLVVHGIELRPKEQKGEEEDRTERGMITTTLPEECIPFTLDSTATSDLKLESPDFQEITSSSSSSSLNNPILIGSRNNTSFRIDELSRKKCLMLSAWELIIEHSDNPQCWKWISSTESIPGLPQPRFSEVVLLLEVYWLDIKGRIETKDLSPNTKYGAYFIYCMAADGLRGLRHPVKVSVYTLKMGGERVDTNAYLHQPIKRADMWMEIEIGEFFCGQVDDVVEMCVKEVEFLNRKSGLVVHGIELRPKEGSY